jgi:cobaltochelatase CobT
MMTNYDALAAAFRAISKTKFDVAFEPSNDANFKLFEDSIALPLSEDFKQLRQLSDAAAAKIRFHNEELHQKNAPNTQDEFAIYDALEAVRCEIELAKRYTGSFKNLGKKTDNSSLQTSLASLLWEKFFNVKAENIAEILVQQTAANVFADLLKNTGKQQVFAKLSLKLINQIAEANAEQERLEKQKQDPQMAESQTEQDDSEDYDDQDVERAEDEQNAERSEEEPKDKSLKKSRQQEAETEQTTRPNFVEKSVVQYTAFTTKFDQVVHASQLCDIVELTQLRAQLDSKIANLKTVTGRLAAKLQQLLLAPKQSVWEYDKDDGLLDSRRFSGFIANPKNNNIYRTEKINDNKDTVVTLLIDNSGSMRGRPIMSAIACADILAKVLEQCDVKVEILGFTTAEWKGGESRKAWLAAGSPPNPGRLNDLRHIIYKSADAPWRKSKRNLGLALRDGLLKENIDGEAILWALKRLNARQEKRKILMVISDGAPVDDSTISVNSNNYLDAHLRQVIAHVEGARKIELLAIGIGHDVNRYYQNAVTIRDISELGDKMFGKMEELFKRAI